MNMGSTILNMSCIPDYLSMGDLLKVMKNVAIRTQHRSTTTGLPMATRCRVQLVQQVPNRVFMAITAKVVPRALSPRMMSLDAFPAKSVSPKNPQACINVSNVKAKQMVGLGTSNVDSHSLQKTSDP